MLYTKEFLSVFILAILQSAQPFGRFSELSFVDGFPTQYLSGSIHYFRVHPTDWRDRLQKLKWAGFHAVQTYIEWASHEPEPEVYDFAAGLDIVEFINIAAEEGLYVILRPGPYICAERDMGGLPYWLLRLEPDVELRTSDERYMKYVRKWFGVLLPLLEPLMLHNGGPVIMVQVENEYGLYAACDFKYTTELADLLLQGLGPSTFLFTTDNGRTEALKCDKIPAAYATVDFGPDADIVSEFEAQRLINGEGPLINSEFYPGWLDHWGVPHETKSTESITSALDVMLSMNASVSFYVFHGGSNFGFGTGSNLGERFQACPTSYDYDAPISEAGDLTEKYFAIRDVALNYFPAPSGPPPSNSTEKYSYGDVEVVPVASVFNLLPILSSVESNQTKTFEELAVPNGLVVYETLLQNSISSPAELSLIDIHDRGYVYVDYTLIGIASREEMIYSLPIIAFPNQLISIVVESQGRISVGSAMHDFKGLLSTPAINGHTLKNWKMTPIPLYNMTQLGSAINLYKVTSLKHGEHNVKESSINSGMRFYEGIIFVPQDSSHPRNTFLRTDTFTKGFVWINNFLLGRYWPAVGPQYALYVPHGVLQQGNNTILILELEGTSQANPLLISLVDTPDIDGPVPIR